MAEVVLPFKDPTSVPKINSAALTSARSLGNLGLSLQELAWQSL